jgi:hypothetical protein
MSADALIFISVFFLNRLKRLLQVFLEPTQNMVQPGDTPVGAAGAR